MNTHNLFKGKSALFTTIMHCITCAGVTLLSFAVLSCGTQPDYSITPVPFTDVSIIDDFWSMCMETNRTVTIPFAFTQCEETGRVNNFAVAGGLTEGQYKGERYNDTDVYKVMEGATYSLALFPDPQLNAYLDSLIHIIASAQEEDGYLFTSRTIDPENPIPGTGA